MVVGFSFDPVLISIGTCCVLRQEWSGGTRRAAPCSAACSGATSVVSQLLDGNRNTRLQRGLSVANQKIKLNCFSRRYGYATGHFMPLTHTRELFAKALKGKYALGAFNVNNMELLQAIIEACEEEKAPVMLQISKGARQYANPVYLKKLIEAAVSLSTIPMAVHLDHGDSFELCKECIDEGFTSVMIDASHEPFEKNVEITKKVVDYAHKHNCVVESELGHLVGAQFDEGEEGGAHSASGHYTVPDEAVKFVQETGCDSLAVAIGNSHGAYKFKGTQHLDLERLKLIKKSLMDAGLGDYPLVLHGASSVPKDLAEEINKYGGKLGADTAGVPEADIEIARRTGCTKVNIDTDLRLAMTAAIRKVFSENPKEFDPRKYIGPARTKVKELVRHKIKNVLCCAGHAFD